MAFFKVTWQKYYVSEIFQNFSRRLIFTAPLDDLEIFQDIFAAPDSHGVTSRLRKFLKLFTAYNFHGATSGLRKFLTFCCEY